MPSSRHIFISTFLLVVSSLVVPGVLNAQPTNPANPTQPGGPQTGPTNKPDGVAEQAPKERDLLPTVPVLPPERSRRRAFELLELDGYFRSRGDWFKQFDLGFNDDPAVGGTSFPNALGCTPTDGVNKPCEGTLKAANIRLRLEPTINVTEKTRVHMQIDVLDNVVLGSTPDSFFGDGTSRGDRISGAFSDGQVAPQAGRNSIGSSLRVKRAWAEVDTSLGLIKFGRMPDHWGMGILANEGGKDPVHGGIDLDSDYGDTEDRLMFSTLIPGTNIIGAVAMDWVAVAPTSEQSPLYRNRYGGQPWDLDDNDDVNQFVFMVSRRDSPKAFKEKVDAGQLALNYGVYFVYRTQNFDQRGVVLGEEPPPDQFVPRDLKVYTPDFWARLGWHNLELEFEGLTSLGSIQSATDLGVSGSLDIRQFGGVFRGTYRFFQGDLRLALEMGWASGDGQDNSPAGATHVSNSQLPTGTDNDHTINKFFFDFDYNIDLILFRELIGTVSNAIYARPSLEYDITDKFRVKGWSVLSFAHRPVSTPGNAAAYGVEFDTDVSYVDDSNGFQAGIAAGVLFPLSALDRRAPNANLGGPGFPEFGNNTGGARTPQTIQLRMSLKF